VQNTPEYPNLRPAMAILMVKLGDAMACLGSREEALQFNQSGMDIYKTLTKNGTDARATRELAITISKRGDILLMDSRPASALESFRQALAILEPMAKADPQNALLRQDVAGAWSNIGRALVIQGRYADGLSMLDRAIRVFEQSVDQNRSLKEIQLALGISLIWRGEALLGAGNASAALDGFEKGVQAFMQTGNGSNGASVALVVGHSKSAAALVALGKTQDASEEYKKALAILEPLKTPQNLPASYAAADVYFGLGDLSKQRQRWIEAREWYQKSADASGKIPNPGAVSPEGFRYRGPAEAAHALAICDVALRKLN
jgi:tetratricopeptide (TPR) repeat protein